MQDNRMLEILDEISLLCDGGRSPVSAEVINEHVKLAIHELKNTQDDVANPKHYHKFAFQHWDVVIDWSMDYLLGCATKYIARLGSKDTEINELRKAIAYIEKFEYTCPANITMKHTASQFPLRIVLKEWNLQGYVKFALRWIHDCKFQIAIDLLKREICFWENHGRGSSDNDVNSGV